MKDENMVSSQIQLEGTQQAGSAPAETSDYRAVAKMIAELSTRRAQGSRWEDLIVAFLTSDPLYRKRFAEVHLWKDWAAKNEIDKQDKGVDIVAVRFDGGLCAVQCKFKSDPAKKLGKGDVDSFIANASPSKYTDRIVAFSGFGVSRNLEQQLADNDVQLLAGMVLSQANVP